MPSWEDISGYRFADSRLNTAHSCLVPPLMGLLESLGIAGDRRRIFELGCGNGAVAAELARRGYDVTGVDPSEEGIALANRDYPELKLFRGSAYDNLSILYGRFPVVLSLEVVEHVYSPRAFAGALFALTEPGGAAIVSTPYHGYWKNLAIALAGKLDAHFTALWDHGHIKFWSMKTLGTLLRGAGFESVRFLRVGRIPPLAKAMIAVARKAPR